jgi:hypothetical protein
MSEERPKFNITFGQPRSTRQRSESVSVPMIQDKWKRNSVCPVTPGAADSNRLEEGDKSRVEKRNEKIQLMARRMHLCIRIVQLIFSYVCVFNEVDDCLD